MSDDKDQKYWDDEAKRTELIDVRSRAVEAAALLHSHRSIATADIALDTARKFERYILKG